MFVGDRALCKCSRLCCGGGWDCVDTMDDLELHDATLQLIQTVFG
jgi:hypothetical protein